MLPEVREVLDNHLDNDPSLAIRAVYGEYFPWLVWLDRDWVEKNLKKIFPRTETLRPMREAAWETYLLWQEPYNDAFSILKDEYTLSIDQIETTSDMGDHANKVYLRLADHLIVLYARGQISLGDPQGLIHKFYLKASDQLCAHAITSSGRSLAQTSDPIEPQVIERLKSLWEWRLEQGRMNPDLHYAELSAFGWWVISKKFDATWLLPQLKTVLEIAGNVDGLVIKSLNEMAADMPALTIDCLDLTIEKSRNRWIVDAYQKDIETSLSSALKSSDSQAQQNARRLINRLAARGYLSFGTLLDS